MQYVHVPELKKLFKGNDDLLRQGLDPRQPPKQTGDSPVKAINTFFHNPKAKNVVFSASKTDFL